MHRVVGRVVSLPHEAQVEIDDFSALLEARALSKSDTETDESKAAIAASLVSPFGSNTQRRR